MWTAWPMSAIRTDRPNAAELTVFSTRTTNPGSYCRL